MVLCGRTCQPAFFLRMDAAALFCTIISHSTILPSSYYDFSGLGILLALEADGKWGWMRKINISRKKNREEKLLRELLILDSSSIFFFLYSYMQFMRNSFQLYLPNISRIQTLFYHLHCNHSGLRHPHLSCG